MKLKQVAAVVLISAATALATMWGYSHLTVGKTYYYSQDSGKVPANYAKFFDGEKRQLSGPVDFSDAASAAIPATVHIKTKTVRTVSNNLPHRNPFSDLFGIDPDDFFGNGGNGMRSMPEMASGSGVIISNDGYIVTNNHVVDGADEVTVTLSNRKSFKAKVVGTDPSSDIAVVKIDAQGLPFLLYGNSDEVKIGQWVLAVGYPLNLETTVTAGIVSAKGRTLDINSRQSKSAPPIESFIQTDAAVNPGNSGGPLINPEGQLIGINSAIASPTGSYAGYSFTIPVNIVKKIVSDIMKFGTPQRAYLGIQYPSNNISDDQKKELGIKDGEGVYVMDVMADGAAFQAGIKKGDVITKLNEVPITTGAEMVGQIATYRPGDKINLTYKRDGKESTVTITLRNNTGTTAVVKTSALDKLGADLQTLDKKDAGEMGVKGGVVVKSVQENGLMDKSRIQEGFIILKANGKDVLSKEEFQKIVAGSTGTIKLEGVFPGYEGVYSFPLKISSGE
ncbi:MAG: trypsin-like peptidase domain-containing protein [Puia sp.]|nr:trypsin-like peptidase domain-containing protein [Puia sp.]